MSRSLHPECRRVLQDISAYLDGDLDASACHAIEAHCTGCASCRDVVTGLRTTLGLCQRAAETPLPEPVLQRARASVRRLLQDG